MDESAHDNLRPDEEYRLDATAVARALAGETGAYDELIEKYQRRAVAVSYRLLGDINDAMDVCQDAFLKAYRSLTTLSEPEKFGGWLMRIVCNLSLNFRRGRKRTLSLSMGDEGDAMEHRLADHSPAGRDDGPGRMQSSEMQTAIDEAIASLPEPQRLALVMFAIEGMAQKDVAEAMECSVEMVKWNVFQARKKLKELLAEHMVE